MPPTRPYLKQLRIAFSAVCGIACVLLIVLWVRSYWQTDAINLGARWGVISENGKLAMLEIVTEKAHKSRWLFLGIERRQLEFPPENYFLGFGYTPPPYSLDVFAPHWFFILVFATFAMAPWIHWSKRFSLRTLLIAMTVIAMILGTVIAMSR